MKKTVTRTYNTKKGVVTKTYTYDIGHKSTRGKTLVGKNGKLNKKNYDNYANEIANSTELTSAEKRAIMADLNAVIKQRKKDGKKLTTSGFEGHRASSELERMFSNLGYSAEELADVTGISVSDLTNKDNWSGDTLTAGGKKYKLNWTYTGSVLEMI